MPEWEFYTAVVEAADCSFMLDINNVYVSSVNHGFDPKDYLAAIDFGRVLQVHLAGHSTQPNGSLIDTHDHPVADAVWSLYHAARAQHGPVPTLLEWDEHIPAFPELQRELQKARGAP
jgi:uncharacterized protein (UPF0276 family)